MLVLDRGSTAMVRRIIRKHGQRVLRYAGVSVVGVTSGQLLLFVLFEVAGLRAVVANTLAVAISTIPSYLLNRAWVWGKSGTHSVTAEILPFWGMALLGLILSNILVHIAEQRWDSWLLVNGANLLAFGSIWIVKYVVLDRVLFRVDTPAASVDTAESVV